MIPLRRKRHTVFLSAAVAWLASLLPLTAQTTLPPGPGADLAYAKCRLCHAMDVVIQSAGITRPMWLGVMEEMKEFGMKVTPDEHEALVHYLATYLGPNPPAPDNKPTPPVASALDGQKLFNRHCSACHGEDGKGVSEQIPPLAGNPYLFKDSRYPIAVLLYGLQGPITIKDRTYEGVMPGFAHLDDAELAAIANYVRTAWGNRPQFLSDHASVVPGVVKAARSRPLRTMDGRELRRRLK